MPTYRRWIVIACVCAVLAIPLGMLAGALLLSGGLPTDLSESDYLALTDVRGGEYVFRPTDDAFAAAVAAFASATPGEAEDAAGGYHILVEWIRDGRARQYHLIFSFAPLLAVLVDADGNPYRLTEAGAECFLRTAAATPSLAGEMPAPLTLGDRAVECSAVEWLRHFTTEQSGAFTLSSGEYVTGAGTCAISPTDFSPVFSRQPDSQSYALFSGDVLLSATDTRPDLAALAPGSYQLVLVAIWEDEALTVRGGYSFVFAVE